MNTHNIYFYGELKKIITKYPLYLFHCWVNTVCPDLSVLILRIITVVVLVFLSGRVV